MADIATLDFETYYDREYSLSKITTEEYVRSPLFEAIGVSIKHNSGKTVWYPQPEIERGLATVDWDNTFLLCQNTAFDAAILNWRYNRVPKRYLDTLCMSRALFPHDKSHSLAAQAKRFGIGEKGTEVANALGKRYKDFTAEELYWYGEYCVNDVELTNAIFGMYMKLGFPKVELQLIDLTLRMFVEPVLRLDEPLLHKHLAQVIERKAALLDKVRDAMLDTGDPASISDIFTEGGHTAVKELLMSNDKFADLLRSFDCEPPTKTSPTTGKKTYAFAKTDEAFKELLDHPNEDVQTLVNARLGNKSTLEETRTQRFIGMSYRGAFPVPLRYYGAHSGRWSGQDSVNLQNLPSRGANAGQIKKAILAPDGYVVIDSDSSQIEARTLAWLAGQDDLVDAFEKNNAEKLAGIDSALHQYDVYKLMAQKIYNVPMDEITKPQRQVGKTVVLGCFGPDTLVLTIRGWIPIIHVQATDMVWDGLRWVPHAGVVQQGARDVWTAHGISATSDHGILTEHGWEEWYAVIKNPSLWKSAQNVVSLPSLSGAHVSPSVDARSDGNLFVNARADGPASSYVKIYSKAVALGAILAPKLRRILNGIGYMKAYAQMKLSARGCLTEYPHVYHGVTTPIVSPTRIMVGAGYKYMRLGGLTESRSLRTFSPLTGMTSRVWNWIGLTWIKDMSRAIFASWGVPLTWQIDAASEIYKRGSQPLKQRMQTYDIAYAGPMNRYTILTDAGPIVVHNCGYGVGHQKLQLFLKTQAGVTVDIEEAKRIINTYRESFYMIPDFWRKADAALTYLASGSAYQVDSQGLVNVVPGKGLSLPNGLFIQYPGLRKDATDKGTEWTYISKGLRKRIYGPKAVENICQAVARCVVAEQMLRIAKRYRVVMTVHDSIAVVARKEEAAEAQQYVEDCMRWAPKWATGLPLACESGVGPSYGDC